MVKLIMLVVIVLVLLFVVKSYLRGVEAKRQAGEPGTEKNNATGTMVRCAQCGVHVPRSESVLSRSKFFCSDEHRLVHFK